MRISNRCRQMLELTPFRAKSTSFIGLGRMGSEMAYNLFSKQIARTNDTQFVICDAIPEAAQAFRANFLNQFPSANVLLASTPEEATIASKTIITMLPSSPQVRTVYSGSIVPALGKLSNAIARDTLCIDSTTLDVSLARTIAKDVAEKGARIVDAPVSGGVTGAKAGTLAFLVGGSEESFELAKPILSMMGQRIIHCGSSGSGLGAKICNNLVLGVEQIVVAEAMLLGQKIGLNPAVLATVINSSTGGCWSSSVNNPVPSALPDKSPPCEKDYEGGFATSLMLKDMGLATDIATQYDSALPLGRVAEMIYKEAIKQRPELAKKDFSSVYRFIEAHKQE